VEEYAEIFPFVYKSNCSAKLGPYLEKRESGPLLTEYLSGIDKGKKTSMIFSYTSTRS